MSFVSRLDDQLSKLSVKWVALENSRPFPMALVNAGLMLALLFLLDRIVSGRFAELPESAYYQTAIIFSLIEAIPDSPILLAIAVIATAVVINRWTVFSATWQVAGFPNALRNFAVFVACVMSWACVTYDYNLFLDRYHHLDRVLLVLLVPCVYWRPIFLVPYIWLAAAYIAQYDLLIGGYSWAQFSMLHGLLLLVVAVLVLRAVIQRDWTVQFLLVAVAVIASHYWIAGLGKYVLDWHRLDEIHRLLPNTYGNGWLASLGVSEVSDIARKLAAFDTPLRVGTLLLEWGVLFVLWRKTSLQAFLVCWIVLHLFIFAVSGIFFWKWILIECSFLIVLQFLPRKLLADVFSRRNFAVSILLIASSAFWSRATNLAWLDMPISYVYRFEAVTEDGQKYGLPPAFFAPYDYQFTLGNFSYLSKQATLPIVWGACSCPALLRIANDASSPQDVLNLESLHGDIRYDHHRVERFDRFMQQFVGAYNRNGGKPNFYTVAKAPRQLWTYPSQTDMPSGSIVRTVNVQQVLTFFDDERYAEIASRPVREIFIQ